MKNLYILNAPLLSLKSRGTFLAILLTLFAFAANAQVGVGTISPDPSAQLDVQSTTKGALIPRMTDTQRTAIPSPATGLLVYQTNGNAGFWYYTGTEWVPLKSTPTSSSSTIIPYASGTPAIMTTLAGGLAGTGSVVGFGINTPGVSLLGGLVDATNLTNMAFSMPRDGVITSISGFFSNTAALALLGTLNIQAQLFRAPEGSNLFSPIPGALVTLSPGLTGVLTIGTTASGLTNGLNIPVTAGTRLLLVYSVSDTGFGLVNTVNGYVSAGVAIN
ncbi:exosporium glycoprotein BclB-related protein [Dyadobacter sp. 676]|uniref:Exosporium glycoprotein BclB-related protein n=1 Tax=Dyadobacter sp. 676 TaxID=3088362 RepID=A0AAU8FQP6_9BACT